MRGLSVSMVELGLVVVLRHATLWSWCKKRNCRPVLGFNRTSRGGNPAQDQNWPSIREAVIAFRFLWVIGFCGAHSTFRIWLLACTEMTKNNKIRCPRVVLVVRLSWASNDINFRLKILHLAGRALPWNFLLPIGNQKIQVTKIPFLTAYLKSAWKTDNWKCSPFYKIPSGS